MKTSPCEVAKDGMIANALPHFRANTIGMSLQDKMQVAYYVAHHALAGPYSTFEEELSAALVEPWSSSKFFHGTNESLRNGDKLLPAKFTGRDPKGLENSIPDRRQYVFFSPHHHVAKAHAPTNRGVVYEVKPIGRVRVDPGELRAILLFGLDLGADLRPERLAREFSGLIRCFCSEFAHVEAEYG